MNDNMSKKIKMEIEHNDLLCGHDKYPKDGITNSCVRGLKGIGFLRIKEFRKDDSNFGSLWLGTGRILAIKRKTTYLDDTLIELEFFENSIDAKIWLQNQ